MINADSIVKTPSVFAICNLVILVGGIVFAEQQACLDVRAIEIGVCAVKLCARLISLFEPIIRGHIMTQRYLLNCPKCNTAVEVDSTQSGQQISCVDCTELITLPSLREIRKLPAVEQKQVKPKASSSQWSPLKRGLFVIGVALLAVCTALGAYTFLSANETYKERERPEIKLEPRVVSTIDRLNPSQLLENWNQLKEDDVAEWREHDYLKTRKKWNENRLVAFIWFGLASVGFLLMILAIVLKN